MKLHELIESLEAKLRAIALYEQNFAGVLVTNNIVLRYHSGFVHIIKGRNSNPDTAIIVDLPKATMFSPFSAGVIKKDLHGGFGLMPVEINFRDAIEHERYRLNEMLEMLKGIN